MTVNDLLEYSKTNDVEISIQYEKHSECFILRLFKNSEHIRFGTSFPDIMDETRLQDMFEFALNNLMNNIHNWEET